MAQIENFNAMEVEPSVGFEPLPAGKYVAVITASEMKTTKKGDGEYLELTVEVIEGGHQGRKLWVRLNLRNPTAEAVRFGRGELSAICRAVGVLTPRDSADLHDRPMVVVVGLKPRKDTGELANTIVGYAAVSSAPSMAVVTTPTPTPVAAVAAGNGKLPPWRR